MERPILDDAGQICGKLNITIAKKDEESIERGMKKLKEIDQRGRKINQKEIEKCQYVSKMARAQEGREKRQTDKQKEEKEENCDTVSNGHNELEL